MFLRVRPDTYEVSHILINTDQITSAWTCFSNRKKFSGVNCLHLGLSSGDSVCIPYLDVEKLVDILARNEPNAIIDALPSGVDEHD